jgi:hypothetical protein
MTRYYALVLVSGGAHTPEEEACEAAAEFLVRIPTPFEHLKWRIDKGMGGQRVDTPACWVWQGVSKIGTNFVVRGHCTKSPSCTKSRFEENLRKSRPAPKVRRRENVSFYAQKWPEVCTLNGTISP